MLINDEMQDQFPQTLKLLTFGVTLPVSLIDCLVRN